MIDDEKALIDHAIDALTKATLLDLKNHPKETAYSECELQEGYHDYLKIQFKWNKIGVFIYDFSWDKTPYINLETEVILDNIAKPELINTVIPAMKQRIADFFFDPANQPMFAYAVKVILAFEYKSDLYQIEYRIEDDARKLELRQRMNRYITGVIYNLERPIKKDREPTVFCGRIVDFNLMSLAPTKIIEILEHCIHHTLKATKNKSIAQEVERSILYNLKEWTDDYFKPLYFDISGDFYKEYTLKKNFNKQDADPEKLALWVYALFLQIKFKDYASFALKELQIASKDFGSTTARQYLDIGTGLFARADIYHKDENVECNANDVFAVISIIIKKEAPASYAKALDFIINLLQKGFPPSYAVKLSSKSEKVFLPIKGIAKSATHRFFNNCLQYAELHDKLEQYALAAMKEFEWYGDIESGEKSCLPGSYAVFGLGLTSEKYFPLVHQYFKMLDDEHQMVHKYFIANLIDRYGITKQSMELICAGILSAQFEMTYKNLATIIDDPQNLTLLIDVLKGHEKYDVENILYSIWGKNYPSAIPKLKSKQKKELLEYIRSH